MFTNIQYQQCAASYKSQEVRIYYESKEKADETKLTAEIKRIFIESRNNYGTRKIKKELDKLEWQVSRRRIGRIMKQEDLVSKAFSKVKVNLNHIKIFHTDRGNEFKNKLIDETLESFQIQRSLSMKGCPYDNAVAEATYKIIKTEFVRGRCFSSLEELNLELADYVNWFNNHRIHSALGYQTQAEYRKKSP